MKQNKIESTSKIKELIYNFYMETRELCSQKYNMAESENISVIYETIQEKSLIQLLFAKVSIVILTANKYEKNIFHANWYEKERKKIRRFTIKLFPQRDDQQETYGYFLSWHGYNILHIEAQTTGAYTLGGSADIVRYVLENMYLYPTVIISLGICFGINEQKQTLGDTVISEKIYPYFMGVKYDESGRFITDNNMFRLQSVLRRKIKSEIIDTNILNNLNFNTYFGNYITGEAVISNKEIRDHFAQSTNQKASAGDMEGYGLFKECCGGNFVIPCVIIKSICDWGVMKNIIDRSSFDEIFINNNINDKEFDSIKDRLQEYASYNACCVLEKFLEKQIFDQSIYTKLKDEIKMQEHERVIHMKRVIEIVKNITTKIFNRSMYSYEFSLTCCKAMEQEGILSYINPNNINKEDGNILWKIEEK